MTHPCQMGNPPLRWLILTYLQIYCRFIVYTWFIWIFFSCLGHSHILQYVTECQLFWPKWLTWFIEELQLSLMKTNRLSFFLVWFALITIFCFLILLLHNVHIFNLYFIKNYWLLLGQQRWRRGESTRLPPMWSQFISIICYPSIN